VLAAHAPLAGTAEQAVTELFKMVNSVGWKILMLELWRRKCAAVKDLCEVDPYDTNKIRSLQQTIATFELPVKAVYELMKSHRSAEQAEELLDRSGNGVEAEYEPEFLEP
jgi:hypothetical protein